MKEKKHSQYLGSALEAMRCFGGREIEISVGPYTCTLSPCDDFEIMAHGAVFPGCCDFESIRGLWNRLLKSEGKCIIEVTLPDRQQVRLYWWISKFGVIVDEVSTTPAVDPQFVALAIHDWLKKNNGASLSALVIKSGLDRTFLTRLAAGEKPPRSREGRSLATDDPRYKKLAAVLLGIEDFGKVKDVIKFNDFLTTITNMQES
ncbi:MAG: hypothetical protein V1848_00060 [Candidatus Magasanikbacteria bacterium]